MSSDYDRWKLRSPDDEADMRNPQEPRAEEPTELDLVYDQLRETQKHCDACVAVLKEALAFIEDEIICGDPDDTGDDAFSFKANAGALADRIAAVIKQAAP